MNILITGASNGIGFSTALRLSENPENNIFAVSRSQEGLDLLKAKAHNLHAHNNIKGIPFDITRFGRITEGWLDEVLGPQTRLDVLINNAGYLGKELFENYSIEMAQKVFETNFFGPMVLCQALIPRMGHNKTGHIVNIGSMSGFQGSTRFPGLSVYGASKSALAAFTESLAVELSERNIKINCLALGSVQTEMLETAFPGYQAATTPDEMARFIADFAMNGWKFFNGQVIPVTSTNP